MKLFFAATVAALASQASAFRVVLDHENNYCLMVVKNDGSTLWTVNGDKDITAAPTTVLDNEDNSPTIAQNGVNDPTATIKPAAQTAMDTFRTWWDGTGPGASTPSFVNSGNAITIYEAGGANALGSLNGLDKPPAAIDWCKAYSTMAPAHYCKADGNPEDYQEPTLKNDIQTCCSENHGTNAGMENSCLEVSTGVKPRGDANWYLSSSNDKCVRNCDVTNLFDPNSDTDIYDDSATYQNECGGLQTWGTSYNAIADCCSNSKPDLQPAYCAWLSTTGSDPSNSDPYQGSDDWYSDASNSLCRQDCPVSSDSGKEACAGTITTAYTDLYTSAADCCSAELSWLIPVGCEIKSAAGEGEPTDLYWPSPSGCRQDCENKDNCAAAPSTSRIYATADECCKQANSWVDEDYCKSRAHPDFNEGIAASSGSDMWYVSYQDGVCRKDCYPASGAASCEWADSGSMTFFDSETSCCKALLGSNDEGACIAGSLQGLTISTVATDKWYVSTSGDQPCAKDCDTSGSAECGGIVSKTGVRLYDSADDCCDQSYSWLNKDLCIKESENVDAPTDLWYVDYGANACKKDCTVSSSNLECGGRPDDISTPMYDSSDTCCSSKLNWVDKDTCVAASESGTDPTDADSPGTGQWRKDSTWNKCVLDCSSSNTIATGDPILTVQPLLPNALAITLADTESYPDQCDGVISDSSAVFYGNSVSNCCKSINWVQEETCVSLSLGVVSQKFFANPSDRTTCLAHQDDGTAGNPIDCTSAGIVQNHAAANGVECADTITANTKLYDSLEDCCEGNVNWDSDTCIHQSKGTEATGSNEYYVDWSLSQCVQDCVSDEANTNCGGIAKAWDKLYSTATACCARLSWLSRSKCVYYKS